MSQEILSPSKDMQDQQLARILYLVHGASFVFSLGAFSFIPLIVNYVKRPETVGSFVESHHTWMIRSFWFYLLWMFLGFCLFVTIIGIPLAWLVWVGAWCWKAYRLVRGLVDLNNQRTMPV